MNQIVKIWQDLFRLFVDDGILAASTIAWLLLVTLFSFFRFPSGVLSVLLFAGLGALFALSTVKRASRLYQAGLMHMSRRSS
jgi:energy-converting hydrogenase Eha subunit G